MRLAVLKERRAGETRVAATPETVRKLVALGLTVAVEQSAGTGASISDADYTAAGAEIAADTASTARDAGVVFAVQLPQGDALAAIPRGALLVCVSGLMADKSGVAAIAKAGVDLAAMEMLPRITRAQSMDVLSSQANLAGYRSVIEGAFAFDRGFPMMMTAAGTVPPARVFVMGAGVAGLQAIATARRLGAIVSATDVRPAAKEEIKSLGATFIGVEDTETAGQTGAYAREMSAEFRQKQAELIAATVAKNDMIICTALVQGGRAPTLVTQAMVDTMKAGSVIVDLASDGGGNCAATRPGEAYTTANGVKILGYHNWPGRIGVAASALYAKNLLTFLTTFWDKDAKAPKLPADDAIIQGVMVTRGGAVVHGSFSAAPAISAPPATPESAKPASEAETAAAGPITAPAPALEPAAVEAAPVTPEPSAPEPAPPEAITLAETPAPEASTPEAPAPETPTAEAPAPEMVPEPMRAPQPEPGQAEATPPTTAAPSPQVADAPPPAKKPAKKNPSADEPAAMPPARSGPGRGGQPRGPGGGGVGGGGGGGVGGGGGGRGKQGGPRNGGQSGGGA